jgi:hypothetical protein
LRNVRSKGMHTKNAANAQIAEARVYIGASTVVRRLR